MKTSIESIKRDVEKATVKILKRGGQGVLVSGQLIITAAHCIDFSCEGDMALGDLFIEEIETAEHARLKVSPYAVEPVIDVAALGSPDEQNEEWEEFNQFCETTKAIRLCRRKFGLFQPFPVHIYSHTGQWLTGTAQQCQENSPSLFLKHEGEEIQGGTSGSPVINGAGELVGIISTSSNQNDGSLPHPYLALPNWICKRILAARRYWA